MIGYLLLGQEVKTSCARPKDVSIFGNDLDFF